MASRSRRAEDGLADAREIARVIGKELREARANAGLSQRSAAAAAGMSRSQWGRIERNELGQPDLPQLCRAGRALGLRLRAQLFPIGQPARDAGQLRLFGRVDDNSGAPLRLRAEVGLPIQGDLRAWDVMFEGDGPPFFADLETHVTDAQAVERRLRLKQRDDPRASVILLVLTRSDHHRRFLEANRELFRDLLPLDAPAILRALRSGHRPPASGLLML